MQAGNRPHGRPDAVRLNTISTYTIPGKSSRAFFFKNRPDAGSGTREGAAFANRVVATLLLACVGTRVNAKQRSDEWQITLDKARVKWKWLYAKT